MSEKTKGKLENRIVRILRKTLKKHPIAHRLCEKYEEDIGLIDDIPIRFEPIDVSAKTVNGEIILNSKLLEGEFRDNMRYLVHEFVHALQQENGLVEEKPESGEYLDDPNEIEAFQAQLDFMDGCYSEEEVQEYLEQLLDHHNIKGKERKRKIQELA